MYRVRHFPSVQCLDCRNIDDDAPLVKGLDAKSLIKGNIVGCSSEALVLLTFSHGSPAIRLIESSLA